MLKWLWLSVVVIALDQLSKYQAVKGLDFHQPFAITSFFNLTLTYNHGAAFSFLSQAGGWQRWFFTALALVVTLVIVQWLRRLSPKQTWLAIALALIAGGALGNVWDRVQLGYVIDFIDVYYGTWHWPAFNIADSTISIGAVMLILEGLKGNKKSARSEH